MQSDAVAKAAYEKYSGEVYGVLCGLTTGEAKSVIKGVVDRGFKQDGFKALVDLNRRYDTRTAASLLQSYLEVVNPPGIKGLEGMAAGIHKWEAKVSALMCRYKEELNSNFKLSILIGMMPRDFQDVILQQGCGKDIGYEQIRDYVLNICHQKMQMLKPVPMDVGQVGQGFENLGASRVSGILERVITKLNFHH